MAETTTIKFQYGLLFVSLKSEDGQQGDGVYIYTCDSTANCFQVGYEFTTDPESQGMEKIGELNRSKQMAGTYVNVGDAYAEGKNIYIIVLHSEPRDEGETIEYSVVEKYDNNTNFHIESTDYELSLEEDEENRLITNEGLKTTVERPEETSIFDDGEFAYKLNLYRLPWGEYDRKRSYSKGEVVLYNNKFYEANRDVLAMYEPETLIGSAVWDEYDPFFPEATEWHSSEHYSYGDIVSYQHKLYRANVERIETIAPGTPVARGAWVPYLPGMTKGFDGQVLIGTKTITENGSIEIIDTTTKFTPNKNYVYFLTIYAEQPKTSSPVAGEEFICSYAVGKTPSCLKFDNTLPEPGELCVVDYPENIANTQNSYGAESFGWTSFNRMGTAPEYLTVIAIQGNKNVIDDWMEQNCDQFVCIAKTDIAEPIPDYNATISGTLLMHLEESLNVDIEGIEVLANNQTYNGSTFGPDDLTYVNGTVDGDTVTRTFVDDQGEPLAEQTVTNAGTYRVKITVHRDEYYNDYEEIINVVVGQAQSDFTILESINSETYDGTTYNAETLVGKSSDGDFTDFTYTVTKGGETVNTISDAGEYLITVTASDSNGNYATKSKSVTFTINKAQLSGVAFNSDTVTYDGTEHALIPSGTENGDTVLYSLDGTTYDLTEAPSYTNAGTYTVYVRVIRDNYEDWAPANGADLTINKKTVQITPGSINIPSIPSNAASTTVNITGTVNVEGVATGDTVGFSTLQATYSSLTFGQQSVTITAALNAASLTNYTLDDSNLTGLTGVVYLVYELGQDGYPSANGSNAHETTEIYLDFEADPGYSVAEIGNKVAITGSYAERNLSGTVSTTTVTENGVTKYRWIIPITRTSTAGTGIDSINVKVTDDYIDPATKSYATYLPTIYWGVYVGDTKPTFTDAIGYLSGTVLTEGTHTVTDSHNQQAQGTEVAWDLTGTGYTSGYRYLISRTETGTILEIQNEDHENELVEAYEQLSGVSNGYSGYVTKIKNTADGTSFTVVLG